jgi:4a-hydroxytetrahydrobiopterin dehydratase
LSCLHEKLTDEQIEGRMAVQPEWKREDDKWIVRRFRFPSFPEAVAFVNAVAEIAEELNHHPLIAIDYKMVTLRLTSWTTGGLTELDFDSAARYDKVYETMGS